MFVHLLLFHTHTHTQYSSIHYCRYEHKTTVNVRKKLESNVKVSGVAGFVVCLFAGGDDDNVDNDARVLCKYFLCMSVRCIDVCTFNVMLYIIIMQQDGCNVRCFFCNIRYENTKFNSNDGVPIKIYIQCKYTIFNKGESE